MSVTVLPLRRCQVRSTCDSIGRAGRGVEDGRAEFRGPRRGHTALAFAAKAKAAGVAIVATSVGGAVSNPEACELRFRDDALLRDFRVCHRWHIWSGTE